MDEQQKKLAEDLLFSEQRAPSFVKQLFFGIFDAKQVFPFPTVSVETKQKTDEFTDQVKSFAQKTIDPAAIDRNENIPEAVLKGLGKLGILGMTIPKKYGGLEMSQYAYCRTLEIIAKRCASTALFINAHQSIGLKALLLFGTDEQRGRWLPPLAKGDQFAAFALTEPNAGSDASGVETRAVHDPERKIYRIHGKKQWITNGGIAEVLTLMARTEINTPQGKEDKITAFLATPEMPGFKVAVLALEKVGMRGTKTANLEFHNLEVPAANILGGLGNGLRICLTVLDYGRTSFGATCTGTAKYAFELAVQHAKTRFQFKRPLAAFPLIKKKIAHMASLIYAMEATTYMTAGFVDRKAEDFMLEAAILKVFASDALWRIIYETMQIFGGRSFFTDAPLERMMRDARLNMIGEGANEVLRVFIGVVGMRGVGMQLKELVEASKNPFNNFSDFLRFFRDLCRKLSLPTVEVQKKALQVEANQLAKDIRRFALSIVKLLSRYREKIVDKELPVARIADSAIALYTITATLSKADSDNNPQALPLAKRFCRMASKQLNRSLDLLFNEEDDEIEILSDQLTDLKTIWPA